LFAHAAQEEGEALKLERLYQYAADLKLDQETFRSCVTSQKCKEAVNQDDLARTAYGVTGTPTLFINGRMVTGAEPFEAFAAEIDQALKNQ
jgi:protein-disulfide isomerase